MQPTGNLQRAATLRQIREIVGDMDDVKLEAILATGVTPSELQQSLAWAEGESDVMGKMARPLEGRVAAAYEILITEAPVDDRDL
jgi:hypothetical protein